MSVAAGAGRWVEAVGGGLEPRRDGSPHGVPNGDNSVEVFMPPLMLLDG
jgi:hypothetical protein